MNRKTFKLCCSLAFGIGGILGMLSASSCNPNSSNNEQIVTEFKQPNSKRIYYIDRSKYSIQVVDGCEYIVSSSKDDITHKGDCPNPIHNVRDTIYMHDTIPVYYHSQIK